MKIAILMVEMFGRELRGTDLLLLAAVVLITVALLSKVRNRRMNAAQRPSAREQIEQDRQLHGVRGDLERLMVDVEQLAREFSARLDAKTLALERLIDEADARIARLRAASTAQQATDPPDTPDAPHIPGDPGDPQDPGDPGAADPLTRSVYALSDQGMPPHDIAERLGEHIGKVELILALRTTR